MKQVLIALLLSSGLAAQTTYVMTGLSNHCALPTQGTNCPYVAPHGEPTYYPWAYATYTTGLPEQAVYPPGGMPESPASGTGSATVQWSNGADRSGTVTVPISCELTGTRPNYQINCSGIDAAGDTLAFTKNLYLARERYGYWNWFDFGGSMILAVE